VSLLFTCICSFFILSCKKNNQCSESSEVHFGENRVSPEKNLKRTVKTPGQVVALENFYNGTIASLTKFI